MVLVTPRLGDGVILTQLNPWTSLPGIQRGMFKQAVQKVTESRQAAATNGAFKKIYNLHISVSADGDKARQWAKRNTSYALAGSLGRYPDVLKSTGVDLKDVERVREAYVNGLGVDEAAKRVSDKLLQDAGFIVAGTPKGVLEQKNPALVVKDHCTGGSGETPLAGAHQAALQNVR